MDSNENIVCKILKGHLRGKKVTKVIAGGSNGSIIILRIGDDYSLFVYCAWRLEDGNKIITGWQEDYDAENGRLTIGIKELKNNIIAKIDVSRFFDLKIHFKGGEILNVFCDLTPNVKSGDYDENWVLGDLKENKSYILKNRFNIEVGTYT